MSSYLVTGGCGFIGSHLAEALIGRGHRVRILDNLDSGHRHNAPAAAELIVDDVADAAAVARSMAGMDGCFHLAAIPSVQVSTEAWAATHRVNLGGTINVLDAARRPGGGVPVIYASSASTYGDSPIMPLTEDARLLPRSPYGADKAGCELHAYAAFSVFGVPSTGLRFFNVYGPRQDPKSPYTGVISIFAERMLDGLPLTVYGDGEQYRDFIYVSDIVRALVVAMERQDMAARVYNVSRGEGTSLLTLIAALERVMGRKADVHHAPARPGDPRRSVGSPALIAAELGVTATVGLEQGLANLLQWLESVRAAPPRGGREGDRTECASSPHSSPR